MKNIKKLSAIASLSVALMLSGCTSSFEDINIDPDAYSSVPYTNQLADVLRRTGSQEGNDLDGYGTWCGYIVKIQYMDYLSGIIPTNNTYGNRWFNCYWCNTQLKDILAQTEDKAEATKNIRSVCKIWSSFLWLHTSDVFGAMPYSEALKGSVEEGSILQAKYDPQSEIYPAVLTVLKTVADDLSSGLGSDELGDGDYIYSGDMAKWQKFCNSLRLRYAIRISNISPDLAKSTIEEIFGNPTKYPVIETNDESCYLWWQGSGVYREPWYSNMYGGRDDHGLFDTFVDFLKSQNDPRIASIMHPATDDGEYRGFENGPAVTPSNLALYSRLGAIYRDNTAGFTPFYKACETFYLKAEATMLGYNTGATAEESYNQAVKLSMADNGISDADAEAYLAGKGKFDGTKERILWDEWVALFKENHEAWCLYRRTGIPTDDVNYISKNSVWGTDHIVQPFRVCYPQNQYDYNLTNVTAAAAGTVDYCWGEQMWWDTRKGVY